MSPSLAQAEPSHSGSRPTATYDFVEKRKRWADLLLTELVDNVPFILSSACKIWFCGVAVTEILGWRDTDLVDLDFTDLIETADQDRFRFAFEQAIETGSGFDISVRLKGHDSSQPSCPSPKSKATVFDIKCHPHIIAPVSETEAETRCLIAMVSPYPSRNAAMLNTMLDVKIQNDVLQRRLAGYRENGLPESPIAVESPTSKTGPMYATSSLNGAKNNLSSGSAPVRTGGFANSLQSSTAQGSLEGTRSSYLESTEDGLGSTYRVGLPGSDDQGEENPKKKKIKRSQTGEQYVCNKCGRTDSPEWRKGPLGPKTLCNACGLRWAKQVRKTDDPPVLEDSLKANPTITDI